MEQEFYIPKLGLVQRYLFWRGPGGPGALGLAPVVATAFFHL